jgi:hypothetical protein
VLGGQGERPLAGLDGVEPAHAALGLRHHLVGDHEHVPVVEIGGRGRGDQRGQVVARAHIGQDVERPYGQCGG